MSGQINAVIAFHMVKEPQYVYKQSYIEMFLCFKQMLFITWTAVLVPR